MGTALCKERVPGNCGDAQPDSMPGVKSGKSLRKFGTVAGMTPNTKKLLERVESWSQQEQEELAEYVREIEARRTGVYHAAPEELEAIDEALGQIARGEIASDQEVEAAFAKFRRR